MTSTMALIFLTTIAFAGFLGLVIVAYELWESRIQESPYEEPRTIKADPPE